MRRNRYTGTCDVCNCQVKPHGGIVVRRPGGWTLRHDMCAPPQEFGNEASGTINIYARGWAASVLVRNGVVVEASQMVCHMHGWTVAAVKDRCAKNSWKFKEISE